MTVTAGPNDQRYPAVAYNALTTEYVVGWQDYRSGSQWDIYVQRVDADGSLDGAEVLVSAEPADAGQDEPAVAYGTAQETHLVVWTDDRNGTDDVYGQLVAGGGALVGAAFAIADSVEDEYTPAVAYDAEDDAYLVVWTQWDTKEEGDDIYAQRVAGDGTLIGTPLAVCTATADQYDPAIVYNATTGHFLVAWQDNRAEVQDLYARAISGTTALAEFLVGTEEESNMLWIDIAANPAGGEYLVVWRQSGDIYARRAGITETYSAAFTISTASAWEAAPAVAFDVATGTYLAVWARADGAQQDIYGQRVSAAGGLLGSEVTIASGAPSQSQPAVAANGAGGYVVAWQEGATNSDIAAAVVDRAGQVLGSGAETLSEAGNTQAAPALSYDAARGRYLVVWADWRNAAEGPDVYGQLYRDYTVVIEYRYDPLHRLAEATYSTGLAFAYEYDAMNNWLTKTETTPLSGTVVTTYTYNAADQLVTARSSADGITWHYTFDDRGSLRRQTPGGTAPAAGEIRYSYDAAGQLVAVELYVAGDYTTLSTAAYNGQGERTRLTTWAAGTPVTITYVLARGAPLVADDGTQATRYLYGRGLVAERETAWVYDLLDGVGSVRLVVDENGVITLTRAYKPFGGILVQSGGYETAFGYLGAQLDRVSGLLYVGGRYYDPATGRFLTPARGPFDPYHPRTNPYVPWQGLGLVLPVALLLAAAYKTRQRAGRRGPGLLLLLAVVVTGMGVAGVLVACGPPVSDCLDTYRLSDGAAARLQDPALLRVISELGIKLPLLCPHPDEEGIVREARETQLGRLRAELRTARPELIVTLGNAALRVLVALANGNEPRIERLSPDPKAYGRAGWVRIAGRAVAWLPLAHPGAPGVYRQVHRSWAEARLAGRCPG